MTGSIICGVDGSADSQAALRIAAGLAERLGTRLLATHVVQPHHNSPMGIGGGAVPLLASQRSVDMETAERLLEETLADTELTEAQRARTEQRVTAGFPAERLADLADEEHAELIVVGSRGRGAFRAAFLGSVSSDVIGVARVPVVVVPHEL
ncbi:MAG TPA: universal stress protein [Gaiellaceae bacterium]